MFRRQPQSQHHHRDSNASSAHQPVSPLQPSFDFGLDSLSSPISVSSNPSLRFSADEGRPYTSDGSGAQRTSIVSLQPPVLPPIPRVASRSELVGSFMERNPSLRGLEGKDRAREESDNVSATSSRVSARNSTLGLDGRQAVGGLDGMSGSQARPGTASDLLDIDFDRPKMEASMFPKPEVPPVGNAFAAGHPAMSRSFIDSRDKPYSHTPVLRSPPVQSSHGSPDMLSPRSIQSSASARSPLSPYSPTSAASSRLSPRSANSYTNPGKAPSLATSRYSGSTARPSMQGSSTTAASPLSHSTVGTAYQDTSSSFPLPQHVATRPKTSGTSSTIAGVMVPTHHTTGKKDDKASKSEKRKTKLLNPMALLQRRRSGQEVPVADDSEELRAHAMAQARQKSVATVGINKLPEDFDPRIRGKIVHDFNAPRPRRNYSYSDASPRSPSNDFHSPSSPPILPAIGTEPQRPTIHDKNSSESSTRHSRHTPIFIEHLTEDPDNHRRMSSIQAERLENKDFLHRASQQSSHHTNLSQESAILPPFARRSQQMDPMQASLFRDDESRRSNSDPPASAKERSSASSSFGVVSPLETSRQGGGDPRGSMSPISPESPDKSRQPESDISAARPFSPVISQRSTESPEQRSPQNEAPRALSSASEALRPQPLSPRTAPGTLTSPPRSPLPISSTVSSPGFDSSIASTPEAAVFHSAVAANLQPASPARLVEKRASAVGHSKRLSTGAGVGMGMPKHAPSTASRFSFQMGGSAEEESALEEKGRRMAESGDYSNGKQKRGGVRGDEDDEDDYFDEDAMDDEDEMETQMRSSFSPPNQPSYSTLSPNTAFGLQNARQALQPDEDDDDGSVYDDDEGPQLRRESQIPYAEHPAFRAHSALAESRHHSMQPSVHRGSGVDLYLGGGYGQGGHERVPSGGSALTLERKGNGVVTDGGPLSHGDAATAPATGLGLSNFGDFVFTDGPDLTLSRPTSSQAGEGSRPPTNQANHTRGVSSPLSGRSGDWNDLARSPLVSPQVRENGWQGLPRSPPADGGFPPNATSGEDKQHEGKQQSAAYHGSVGKGIRARNVAANQNSQYAASDSGEEGQDDMYFDDGGFDFEPGNTGSKGMDENDFDNPSFLGGYKGMQPRGAGHPITASADISGPYPTFAIPNPAAARQRDSRLLLEDLPLQDAPINGNIDPRWIPQRNPSEDAKRLGLSTKVPPLPTQSGSEGSGRLQAYHQALADAANRAASDGRFLRMPSVSTARSGSVYSTQGPVDDDRSRYSQDEGQARNGLLGVKGQAAVNRSTSQTTTHSRYDTDVSYSPPKMSFDFGFERAAGGGEFSFPKGAFALPSDAAPANTHNGPPTDAYNPPPMDDYNAAPTDSFLSDAYDAEDPDDDYMNDPSVIAAANAEVLASDDAAFYGSEFGFYAQARRNSATEAVNGGFFGDEGMVLKGPGDRGFLAEPNLTPITERSEFSTRNSFVGAGFGMPSAGAGHWVPGGTGYASPALARLPVSPLVDTDVAGLEQLRKLRLGGGAAGQSPGALGLRNSGTHSGYFGHFSPATSAGGGMVGTNGTSSPATAAAARGSLGWGESPVSATGSVGKGGLPFSQAAGAHSRSGSGVGNEVEGQRWRGLKAGEAGGVGARSGWI